MKRTPAVLLAAMLFTSVSLNASTVITETTTKTTNNSPAIADDIVVQDAMAEFRSLSRVEKKMRIAEVKKVAKEFKVQKAAGTDASTDTILLAILAILLPPLAVYLHENATNSKFWLSLILTLLFWIPGVIYALFVVL